MELDCRGCAGCCLDWRPLVAAEREGLSAEDVVSERRGPYPPLSGAYNLVPLDRDEVRGFVAAGLADALTPRLWLAEEDDPGIAVDGHRVAAVGDRPAFFIGLRKPPKPVAPFDCEDARWLETCIFLDPETLQCRIYEDERYPNECAAYPAHTIALDRETECERVEAAVGGERLLSREVDEAAPAPLFGPQAIGGKLFCHPEPERLSGVVDRLADGDATAADRAEFVAVAAASSPGTTAISGTHYERAREQALAASSWAGEAIADWEELNAREATPEPTLADRVERDRGAPVTPGWDAVD